jgi:hypothetical protein
MRLRQVLPALLLALLLTPAFGSEPVRFHVVHEGDYARLVAAHRGRPFLIVLWSITCAPCRDELKLISTLRRQRGPLPVVLISTDGPAERARAAGVLREYALGGTEAWIFSAADPARLRFEIDPEWFGEMPRAYFYDAAGGREAVSGSLQQEKLEAWLARPAGPVAPPR